MTCGLLTYTGRTVDVQQPDPATICLEDIAHGLAYTIRYCGALGVPLTVAQHSVLLSHWASIPKQHRTWALFHDAAEAYLGDVPAPVVELSTMSGFHYLEQCLLEVMAVKYGLEGLRCPESVRLADKAMLQYEVEHFNENKAWAALAEKNPASWIRRWGAPPKEPPFKGSPFEQTKRRLPWTPDMAKYLWLLRAKQLGVTEVA